MYYFVQKQIFKDSVVKTLDSNSSIVDRSDVSKIQNFNVTFGLKKGIPIFYQNKGDYEYRLKYINS